MSLIKVSELPKGQLTANLTNTIFLGVDLEEVPHITYKYTANDIVNAANTLIQVQANDLINLINQTANSGGGGGSSARANGNVWEVQYNANGIFAGSPALTTDGKYVKIQTSAPYRLEITTTFPDSNSQLDWYSIYQSPRAIDSVTSSGVAYDSTGNVYIMGSEVTQNNLLYLVQYNSQGDLNWQLKYGEISNYQKSADAIATYGQYIYILSSTIGAGGEMILAKINTSSPGGIVWQQAFQLTEVQKGYSICVDSSGNILVSGMTTSQGAGQDDVFIAKFDNTGSLLWQQVLGGVNNEDGYGITTDSTNNVYVTGDVNSSVQGLLLAKYDTNGNPQWARALNSVMTYGADTIADSTGNVYICGTSYNRDSNGDLLIVKYASTGDVLWQKLLGGAATDFGYSIALDSSDNIYITGITNSQGTGLGEILIVKYNSIGTLLWQRTFNGSSTDAMWYWNGHKSIAVHNDKLVVTAYYVNANLTYSTVTVQLPVNGAFPVGDMLPPANGTIITSSTYGEFTYTKSTLSEYTSTLLPVNPALTSATGLLPLVAGTLTGPTNNDYLYNKLRMGPLNPGPYYMPLSDGLDNQIMVTNGEGSVRWDYAKSQVAGTNYQVQYNSNGQFAGANTVLTDGNTFLMLQTSSQNRVEIGTAIPEYAQGPNYTDTGLYGYGWVSLYGNTATSFINGDLAVGSETVYDNYNNVYVIGQMRPNDAAGDAVVVILKYNSDGVLIWQQFFKSYNAIGYFSTYTTSIDIDPYQDLFVSIQNFGGESDVGTISVVAKLDSTTGNIIWQQDVTGLYFYNPGATITSVGCGDTDYIFISGNNPTNGSYPINRVGYVARISRTSGDLIWYRNFIVSPLTNGQYTTSMYVENTFVYITSMIYLDTVDPNGDMLVKYNGSGGLEWSTQLIGPTRSISSIAVEPTYPYNVYALTATISGFGSSPVPQLIKFNNSGTLLWQKEITTDHLGELQLTEIKFDPSGRLYGVGHYQNRDTYTQEGSIVINFDSDGNIIWNLNYYFDRSQVDVFYAGGISFSYQPSSYPNHLAITGYINAYPFGGEDQSSLFLMNFLNDGLGGGAGTYNLSNPLHGVLGNFYITPINVYSTANSTSAVSQTMSVVSQVIDPVLTISAGYTPVPPSLNPVVLDGRFWAKDLLGGFEILPNYFMPNQRGTPFQVMTAQANSAIVDFDDLHAYGDNYDMQYNNNGYLAGANTVITDGTQLVLSSNAPLGSGLQNRLPQGLGVVVVNSDFYVTGNVIPRITQDTYDTSITINWQGMDYHRLTLTGDIVITNIGAIDGQKCVLELTQDIFGFHNVSFDANTVFGQDISFYGASTTGLLTDKLGFIYNSASNKYSVVALARGF